MSSRRNAPYRPPPKRKGALAQSIDLARTLLTQGKQASAESVLGTILTSLPDDPDALHLMGALRNMQGRAAQALVLLERAVQRTPAHAGRWNDLGLIYVKLAREADAMAAFQRSIELAGGTPLAATAHDNLGRLQIKSDAVAAEQSFRRALELMPESGRAWYGLAQALVRQDRLEAGVAASRRAVELAPKNGARELLAMALADCGHTHAAVVFYQQWVTEEPDNPVIKHHLTALTQPDTPLRASDAYIETTFDNFAADFDRKLALLAYQAPALIGEALRALHPEPRAGLDIADAGCGTGLCGPLLLPWARRLCGFDLSGGMIARAQQRAVYGELHQFELVSFLSAHPDEFDVVISADTLCYFGQLDVALIAAQKAVRAGGHIIFTVEALDDDRCAHRLQPNGRYVHSRAHVLAAAVAAGLQVSDLSRVTLRQESGVPVPGWLVTLGRP